MTKPQLRPCDLCKQDDETKCEEIKQAIREAWVEWHEDVSYVYTPSMPTPAFIQGFKAAVKWMEEKE